VADRETKAERREAARKARLEAQRKAQRRKQLRKVKAAVVTVLIAAIIGGLVWWSGADERKARKELNARAAAAGCTTVQSPPTSGGHLTAEEEQANTQVKYNSEPPSSGKHSGTHGPVATGVHSTAVPDEWFVHNLEHGHIGVFYDADKTPAATVDDLENWVREDDRWRFITPRPELAANDVEVAISSWGHYSTCAAPTDSGALVRFFDTYAKVYIRQGPETAAGTPG
jgi:hypothetical protein